MSYPEIFAGAGLLNGGLPGIGDRYIKEYFPNYEITEESVLQAREEAAWVKTKEYIDKQV